MLRKVNFSNFTISVRQKQYKNEFWRCKNMPIGGYIAIGSVALIIALSFYSTMRFNRKKPMTREEYEAHEAEKKEKRP